MFDDVGNIENGSIVGWDCGVCREEKVATRVAACIGLRDVAVVTVDS